MKSILLSLKPKQVANVLNGKQMIIVCKKFPKDYVGWVYIYCTKDNKHKLEYTELNGGHWSANDGGNRYNGKVVGRFWCDKVEEISKMKNIDNEYWCECINRYSGVLCQCNFEKMSCLSMEEIEEYTKGKTFYAIHISKLEVFDKPRELSEFRKYGALKYLWDNCIDDYVDDNWNELLYLQKAPQNYCYIESEK